MAVNTLREMFPAVAFGTSGVRALVSDLSAPVVAAYVGAFARHLETTAKLVLGKPVMVGIDLRPSSPAIASVICQTVRHLGFEAEYLGSVPTPALALHCLQAGTPGIMVTGSHIPFDRNGIKFYLPKGEILKEDEIAISGSVVDPGWLAVQDAKALPPVCSSAAAAYVRRYIDRFGPEALRGLRIGLYEHSAVGRDLTRTILEGLGATVIPLGRSDAFVPIDTEAVGEPDLAQARSWCAEHRLDALVSTDGDGDRPLVFDEQGGFVRGDLLGLLTAKEIGLCALAVPVSCNTAIEKSGCFERVLRTRIGSPYVIAGMNELVEAGYDKVGGFEANGGFLLGSPVNGLHALPTRDALLPLVTVLVAARHAHQPVSALVRTLPARFTYSDRIKEIPTAVSAALLQRLQKDAGSRQTFFGADDPVVHVDTTDGLRVSLASGDIVHLRPSGNAPELRCYAEADSEARAMVLVEEGLLRVQSALTR